MDLNLQHEHPWKVPVERAVQIQEELRAHVLIQRLPAGKVQRIAGADNSFFGDKAMAAVVVLDYATLDTVDQATAEAPVTFPYIPGLLSFREAPAILAAPARLDSHPDVLMIDGHGLAHPRRFGIACHIGVLIGRPTIGCAKSLLTGKAGRLDQSPGSTAEITHRGEVLGVAIRTRQNAKPVYVSAGYRVDLPSAMRVVLECGQGYRLPEPTRRAHQLATEIRRGKKASWAFS